MAFHLEFGLCWKISILLSIQNLHVHQASEFLQILAIMNLFVYPYVNSATRLGILVATVAVSLDALVFASRDVVVPLSSSTLAIRSAIPMEYMHAKLHNIDWRLNMKNVVITLSMNFF